MAAATTAVDTLGNSWTLKDRLLRCEPGDWGLWSAPEQLQPAVELALPFDATGAMIDVDAAGCIWVLVHGGLLLRLDPRAGQTVEAVQKHGWTRFDALVAAAGATASGLARLPSGHVALQTDSGEEFAVDIEGAAQSHTVMRAAELAQPPVAWDPSVAPDLPFGNHDIHACELGGRLYIAGGLAMVGAHVRAYRAGTKRL